MIEELLSLKVCPFISAQFTIMVRSDFFWLVLLHRILDLRSQEKHKGAVSCTLIK